MKAVLPSPSPKCAALRDIDGKGDTPARRHQANALVELIRQVRQGDERLVVCGDFNVLAGERNLRAHLSALGLSDLITSRGHRDTRTSLL